MANIIRGEGTVTIKKWSGEVVMNDKEFADFLVAAIGVAVRANIWNLIEKHSVRDSNDY